LETPPPQQLRQQLGWQTAQQAAQLLRKEFAATKIVLFGSMLHAQHIRPSSDIDLAVWGLPNHAYCKAISRLFKLDSAFSIDLVLFEQAPLSLRQSIVRTGIELSDTSQSAVPLSVDTYFSHSMSTHHAPLIGLIRQNLNELAQLTENTQQLLIKYLQTQDEDYLGTLALNLHSFYSGAERIFREIARDIDSNLPTESDWHRRLLRQMSASLPDLRQPVITPATRTLLEDYCAFRHVVRNIYTMQLKGDRIQPLVAALPNAFAALKQDCEAFSDSLSAERNL
ncbi:nucleotidyltransferase family protein, partial [cf. Phormidesmis sp. LEGE 11477]|uniref:nucleotidyltransferase family protein n=1 Tax=cf. Phormidesmis sp. LEGE 11477 TaxID=1828680 RepID=UPI0018809718